MSPLKTELNQLKQSAEQATGHPILPRAAREAIGSLVTLAGGLVDEVERLNERIAALESGKVAAAKPAAKKTPAKAA